MESKIIYLKRQHKSKVQIDTSSSHKKFPRNILSLDIEISKLAANHHHNKFKGNQAS